MEFAFHDEIEFNVALDDSLSQQLPPDEKGSDVFLQ
jgi:hypothetical protein